MSKRLDWQKRLFIFCFLLPGLALYTLFVAYPAVEGLRISMMGESLNISLRLAINGLPASGSWAELAATSLANYKRLLFEVNEPTDLYRVRRYLSNSVFLFVFTLLDLVLGFVVAYILTRRPRGAPFFRVVYFFPSILSVAVSTILWATVLHPRLGLLNQMLRAAGLGSWVQPWLSQVKMLPFAPLALYSLAIVGIWGSMGITILLFSAAIQNVPETLYEAARIDGASETQSFIYVTAPLVWEMFRTLLVLRVIGLFGSLTGFTAVHILFSQRGSNAWLISNYYYYHAFAAHNWSYAAAIIVAVTVVAFLLAAVTLRLTRREPVTY